MSLEEATWVVSLIGVKIMFSSLPNRLAIAIIIDLLNGMHRQKEETV